MSISGSWSELTRDDKQRLRDMRAVFVMASREISKQRLSQLIKPYLAKGNVIIGISNEPFVIGYENQPQFRMMDTVVAHEIVQKVAVSSIPHQLIALTYPQQSIDDVIRALRPKHVLVVRGSYARSFYLHSTYGLLERRRIPFTYESPFSSNDEAHEYYEQLEPTLPQVVAQEIGDAARMMELSRVVAKRSFDYSFQVGAVLADKHERGNYVVVDMAANEVVPYQTYALHYGNSREDNKVPHNDANHYDTIHAEMHLLVRSGEKFRGKTLFLNMLPCPNCARVLCKTGLAEIVYHLDHSEGYAKKLLELSGIKTRKVEL